MVSSIIYHLGLWRIKYLNVRSILIFILDNLYLDLNGIVHNCIHGNDAKLHERVSKLTDFDEVWANIMKAIDEIVHTVKPRKLLFLAVDGVAPRAKMNQ